MLDQHDMEHGWPSNWGEEDLLLTNDKTLEYIPAGDFIASRFFCLEFMVQHSNVIKADLMVYEEGRSKGKQIDEFIEGLWNIRSEVGDNQDGGTFMLIPTLFRPYY